MKDTEIISLKSILKRCKQNGEMLLWFPDDSTCHQVSAIGIAPTAEGDEPEPSEVAFIGNRGKYVALYNCPMNEFVVAQRLPSTPPAS